MSSSSGSNGGSNKSLMGRAGEIGDLVEAVTQTLDAGRAAGLLVRLDHDRVQSRILSGGLETGGHSRQEASKRPPDLDAHDRILRDRHHEVPQAGGGFRYVAAGGRL